MVEEDKRRCCAEYTRAAALKHCRCHGSGPGSTEAINRFPSGFMNLIDVYMNPGVSGGLGLEFGYSPMLRASSAPGHDDFAE